jgi:hypothetical protein
MPNIESIVREINKELTPQFEEKLRAYLADQDKDWLIEQIIRPKVRCSPFSMAMRTTHRFRAPSVNS